MREISEIVPQQWQSPCGSQCVHKFAALTQIPWRVFCKKGCGADGETMDECIDACDHICYKDPVLENQQWSAYIDRSPGAATYSEECFHACVAGCGFKFDVPAKKVDEVHPNRPTKLPAPVKPCASKPIALPQTSADDDMISTSA